VKGVRYVCSQQQQNGVFAGNQFGNTVMYSHGICTLMVSEVIGLFPDRKEAGQLRARLAGAVQLIRATQCRKGIWDVWPGPEGKVFTVAILTTTPNDLTRTVHDRMPVILKPEDEAAWLDPAVEDPDRLLPLVGPYPADRMAADPANPALNKPSFEGPDCLVPPAAAYMPPG
jgi:hypothetical protein